MDLSSPTLRARFESKIVKPKYDTDGCWNWSAAKDRKGYGVIGLGVKQMGIARAHRVAWALANGPITSAQMVCHKCDNPACVRVDHLFIGTNQDNLADMVKKGRSCRGEQRGRLTEQQVREIRTLHERGTEASVLAAKFNVTRTNIRLIANRQRWAHVV